MDNTAFMLSRIQFGANITFHILFPTISIGLAWVLVAFFGLAFSQFPFVIIDKMTVWQAASATESLWISFIGCAVTLPVIFGYTIFSYRVFWGKANTLSYK